MSYVLGGQGKHDVFTITKSGELQVPKDASLLWGGGSVDRILNEEADLLGNAILASGRKAGYDEVAAMLPPALQGGTECSDYNFCADPAPARTHCPVHPRARCPAQVGSAATPPDCSTIRGTVRFLHPGC